jgi:hypothetical protein
VACGRMGIPPVFPLDRFCAVTMAIAIDAILRSVVTQQDIARTTTCSLIQLSFLHGWHLVFYLLWKSTIAGRALMERFLRKLDVSIGSWRMKRHVSKQEARSTMRHGLKRSVTDMDMDAKQRKLPSRDFFHLSKREGFVFKGQRGISSIGSLPDGSMDMK